MTHPSGPAAADDGAAGTGVPTCYRHPDRETYVRCTRCERPICPDDMRSASVGFQCPECVAEGNRTVRQPRTVLGGRVSPAAARVTFTLLGLNVLAFLVQQAVPGFTSRFSMLPSFPGGPGYEGVAGGEYYRLITAAFLHAGLLHIGFNMYALMLVGPQLEAVLGRARFLALYLLSALGGSALSYAVGPLTQQSVGASGAIFGLFGALLVVSRRLNYDVRPVLGVIGLNLVITFLVPSIDWRAHIGGLVTGVVLAAAFAYAPPRLRPVLHTAAPVLIGVLLVGAVLLRSSALHSAV